MEKTCGQSSDSGRIRQRFGILHATFEGEIYSGFHCTACDKHAEAVNVLSSPNLFNWRVLIMERLAEAAVLAIYQFPEMAPVGPVISAIPSSSGGQPTFNETTESVDDITS